MKSNHNECQASQQRITERCNASSFKQCNVTKEVHVEIRVVQKKKVSREDMKQETSSRLKRGFEIIVKVCIVDEVHTFQNCNPNMFVFG